MALLSRGYCPVGYILTALGDLGENSNSQQVESRGYSRQKGCGLEKKAHNEEGRR